MVGLNLMRQSYWRRSGGSILLCTCAGIVIYEMLNFLFGRPLMYTVIMFGIDARANADGSITLVQTTKATLKR